jgi:DNA-binding PadR family transcriptional regulator
MRDHMNTTGHHGHHRGPWHQGEGHPGRNRWPGHEHPHGQGHGHGHGHMHGFFGMRGGRGWGGRPGGPGGPGGARGFGGFGEHGGPPWGRGRRLLRGALRYIILGVLSEGPRHGYEIIKHIEERTGGMYSPSPGTIYPTLQYLEELGQVRSNQEQDRRVYEITESGRTELDKQREMMEHFWSGFGSREQSSGVQYEMSFVGHAMNDLMRTINMGLQGAVQSGDQETLRKMRQALERYQNEIREIIAGGSVATSAEYEDEGEEDITEPEGEQERGPNDTVNFGPRPGGPTQA